MPLQDLVSNHDIFIRDLENQISLLEKEILTHQLQISEIENLVHYHLKDQIILINELEALYKVEKKAKKQKRVEQKRKGKKLQETTGIILPKVHTEIRDIDDEDELKRLYKGAIVKVHPDRFMNDEDKLEKAHEVTTQLIEFYKSKDLAKLKNLYDHIVSGNAISYSLHKVDAVENKLQLIQYLENKMKALEEDLESLKSSELIEVANTYENPLSFVTLLRNQFDERIETLKKRTRKSRKNL